MGQAYDLVIRGGTVVDGLGGDGFVGDVAVLDGRIAAVGEVAGSGAEEIDAGGRIVTPGFVDVHTHYDGQATWESRMQPSSWHGVTTVIGGNCGVGFAPCRPNERDLLVTLMEGVEDVPEVVMTQGLPWAWETFPQYLDFLAGQRFDVDVGMQIPHSPIRVFVMGERGARREPATAADIARMADLVEEGVRAGGFGVSTSRYIGHRTKAGDNAPSYEAGDAELIGLAQGLGRTSAGIFQLVPAVQDPARGEYAVMTRIVEAARRPLAFSLLSHEGWRDYLDLLCTAQPADGPIRGQVFPRPVGVLMGLDLSFHPFSLKPSYRALAGLPLAERVAQMRKPEVRARLLSERSEDPSPENVERVGMTRDIYLLGDPPVYDPSPEDELGRKAARLGIDKAEYIYDILLQDEGRAILYLPGINFVDNRLDAVGEMLRHPNTVVALGDGGAHYGLVCDASYPTFLLTYWSRDARPGEGLTLPAAVRALSAEPAAFIGLTDRGTIAAGMKADLNVIDLDRLTLRSPSIVHDLPGQGRRLRQKADGYLATIVNGQITYRDGVATGTLPGRLIRRGHDHHA